MKNILLGLSITLAVATGTLSLAAERSTLGTTIDKFSAADFRGKEISLADFSKHKLVVVAFLGTECPLANRYAPRLNELAAEFGPQGVGLHRHRFESSGLDWPSWPIMRTSHDLKFPLLKDAGNVIADQFSAERTPEVFVLDKKRAVRIAARSTINSGGGNSSGYAQTESPPSAARHGARRTARPANK